MAVIMKGRSTGSKTVELVHESGVIVNTMAPKDNGGDGSSFSPTDLCAVSLGACGVSIMSMFAENHGLPLEKIEFELSKEMSAAPRKIARIGVRFRIFGALSDKDFDKIVAVGKVCPVLLTLKDSVAIDDSYERGL